MLAPLNDLAQDRLGNLSIMVRGHDYQLSCICMPARSYIGNRNNLADGTVAEIFQHVFDKERSLRNNLL